MNTMYYCTTMYNDSCTISYCYYTIIFIVIKHLIMNNILKFWYFLLWWCFLGFHLNTTVLDVIITRYADQQSAIDFDGFVACMIRLELLFRKISILITPCSELHQHQQNTIPKPSQFHKHHHHKHHETIRTKTPNLNPSWRMLYNILLWNR